MKSGTKPTPKDHRDYSFKRTFGAISPQVLPDEFNVDKGYGCPNQTTAGLPFGCTGYTQSELCQDEDSIKYNAKYTYDKTLFMEGNYGQAVGCDIRDSFKSLTVYGALPSSEPIDQESDTKAGLNRRGRYFNVIDPTNGTDDFDDVRSAIFLNGRSISIGWPWFPEFSITNQGMLTRPHDYDLDRASWHNFKISGWKLLHGEVFLIGKTWQGIEYGDKGFCYIGRDMFNQMMKISGTCAYTTAHASLQDLKYIRLDIISTILSYCRMWLLQLI